MYVSHGLDAAASLRKVHANHLHGMNVSVVETGQWPRSPVSAFQVYLDYILLNPNWPAVHKSKSKLITSNTTVRCRQTDPVLRQNRSIGIANGAILHPPSKPFLSQIQFGHHNGNLDSKSLDLVAQGLDLASQLTSLVGVDASGDDSTAHTAGAAEQRLAGNVDVGDALVLAQEGDVQKNGEGLGVGG